MRERREPDFAAAIKDKLVKVKEQMKALGEIGERMKATSDGQVSLTEPDARSMVTSGRGTGMVRYNVQTVVDARGFECSVAVRLPSCRSSRPVKTPDLQGSRAAPS